MGVAMPAIVTRAGWGCPQPDYSSWPPEHQTPYKIIVHHTVTPNYDSNPVGTIQGIWDEHAIQNGWGDIGYNLLVDQSGTVYEGRLGGIGVVGGHALQYNRGSIGVACLGNFETATAPLAMVNGLIGLLAWLCQEYSIAPGDIGFFIDGNYPNLMGHRDCMNTLCPGQHLYDLLPSIRLDVWNRLNQVIPPPEPEGFPLAILVGGLMLAGATALIVRGKTP